MAEQPGEDSGKGHAGPCQAGTAVQGQGLRPAAHYSTVPLWCVMRARPPAQASLTPASLARKAGRCITSPRGTSMFATGVISDVTGEAGWVEHLFSSEGEARRPVVGAMVVTFM